MRVSTYFFHTLKETPAEASTASHCLMLKSCMIAQVTSGIYAWLPLGMRVLDRVARIVREEQNRINCHEVIIPTIQPADLWKKSGRYEDYGKEMLRIRDRHDRELLYGPTAEEVLTDVFQRYVKSYKDLPMVLYQIHWKFRDEIRPRFGVMRGREFLMKDGYSFDLTAEGARRTYRAIFDSYCRTFERMGLKAIPVRAETGPIGGDLSHEFHIVAETGESALYYDARFNEMDGPLNFERMQGLYSAADDQHKAATCPVPQDQLCSARGIEVGHIFNFGTKYSEPLGAIVTDASGSLVPVEMGSYGIGVTRVVGGLIEAFHDDRGMIWPEAVAPFDVALINLKSDDQGATDRAEAMYTKLQSLGCEVLYDDRPERVGVKFADMDLTGVPYQVLVSPKNCDRVGEIELKDRKTGRSEFVNENRFWDALRSRTLSSFFNT